MTNKLTAAQMRALPPGMHGHGAVPHTGAGQSKQRRRVRSLSWSPEAPGARPSANSVIYARI
jgi:hypothetical protein